MSLIIGIAALLALPIILIAHELSQPDSEDIEREKTEAQRQVVIETLRVKRLLDDQAFLARQALLKAATEKSERSDS